MKIRNVLSDYLGYVTTEKMKKPASYGKHKRSISVTRLQRKKDTVHSYTHTHTHTNTHINTHTKTNTHQANAIRQVTPMGPNILLSTIF